MNTHLQIPSLDKITNFTSSQYLPLHKQSPNYHTLLNKIKLVKYPALPFRHVQSIDQFITHVKSPVLLRNFKTIIKTENNINFIRKVRGDGNCFIRAIAFQYLAQINSFKLSKCFPYLDSVVLTISDKSFIPKNFIEFYDDDFLSYCLKQNWETLYSQSLQKYNNSCRLALAALFAENPYLDFITVLYMRAISVLALRRFSNDDGMKEFLQENDDQKLRNYGNLSDGLSHFLLSKLLSIELNIYEVRDEQIIKYNYPVTNRVKFMRASLLYHHNHYDLLQKQADISQQLRSTSLNRKESYYSQASKQKQLVQGQCINCQQWRMINVENCLCEGCFIEYQQKMKEYNKQMKDKNKKKSTLIITNNNNNNKSKYNNVNLQVKSGYRQIDSDSNMSPIPKKKLKTTTIIDDLVNNGDQNKSKKHKSKRRRLFGCFG